MAKSSKPSTLDKFGDWEVLEDGSLFECINSYHITPDRFNEPDWWIFFRTDPGHDWGNYMKALFRACEVGKIKELNMKMSDE